MNVEWRRDAYRDAIVAVGFVALFLVGLERPELLDPDESRHAEIAGTMLAEHRFVTPRLYGVPYYDKPVGYHWMAAASVALLGRTTTAARLPSALAALVTLATTAWWARRIRGRTAALLATVMLGTCLLFVALGRFGGIDMLFTALLTAAIARLSVTADDAAPGHRSVLGFYALIGLAALVKGPVALVLAIPPFVAAAITTRERENVWLTPWRGAATILLIAGPWYVAAAITDPTYIRVFLETHNLARFTGSEALPHQQSIGYYIATLPLALLPWTPLVAAGAWARLRGRPWSAAEIVLGTWIATVFGVFSAAGTRLITYLLPAFPAVAVLASIGLADRWSTAPVDANSLRYLKRWTLVWGATICTAVMVATGLRVASKTTGVGSVLPAAAAFVAAVAYGTALWRARRLSEPGFVIALLAGSTVVAAAGTYGPTADLLTASRGFRALGATLARDVPPDGVVLSLSRAPHALSFYSGHTIGRVESLDAARDRLAVDDTVLLLTKQKYADALEADPTLKVQALWRNAQGTALVANTRAAAEWRRREGVEPSADHDGRHHGFEDRSGHRTRSLSSSSDRSNDQHP